MVPYVAICAVFFLVLLSGCNGSQTDGVPRAQAGQPSVAENAQNRPRADEVARDYRRLRLITKEPVLVDPQLAMFCVGVSQQRLSDAQKRSGPHAHTSIRVYMNDLAAGAFRQSMEYPVGSVIVKEKQGLEYNVSNSSPQASAKTSDGVGGMIKRSPSYDPEHGDWEYFYFEDPLRIEHGKITSCIECHRSASASDYVFGDWANGG